MTDAEFELIAYTLVWPGEVGRFPDFVPRDPLAAELFRVLLDSIDRHREFAMTQRFNSDYREFPVDFMLPLTTYWDTIKKIDDIDLDPSLADEVYQIWLTE